MKLRFIPHRKTDILGHKEWVFPWDELRSIIDRKFRVEYYDSLNREVPKVGYPANEIYESDVMAQKNHPFLYKVWEFCTTINVKLSILKDRITYPYRWYRMKYKHKTHVIPTGLKVGQWHDSRDKFIDGTFSQVYHFVTVEDYSTFDYYNDYAKQGKLEKLRSELGDDRVDFIEMCIEVVVWYKCIRPELYKEIDAIYELTSKSKEKGESIWKSFATPTPPVTRKLYNDINEIENKINDTDKKHCVSVMNNVHSFWG